MDNATFDAASEKCRLASRRYLKAVSKFRSDEITADEFCVERAIHEEAKREYDAVERQYIADALKTQK